MTKSVNSAPIWPPNPAPAVAIADGADQDPSPFLATTNPDPTLPENKKPALSTVIIANPLALERTEGGIILSGPKLCLGSTNEAKILEALRHSLRRLAGRGLLIPIAFQTNTLGSYDKSTVAGGRIGGGKEGQKRMTKKG
jgi:hypothetical protein